MSGQDEALGGANKPNTFIGRGSEFEGKLTFDGIVRIDGKIDGEIFSKGTLIIGPDAEVSANIQVDTVFLSGLVRGDIQSGKKIVMKAPGRLYGNIQTPVLVVDEGVLFEGNCRMENLASTGPTSSPSVKPPLDVKPANKPPLNLKNE